MKTAQKYIDELSRKIDYQTEKIQGIEELLKLFPDLSIDTDRWKRERFVSSLINKETSNLEIHLLNNCGCCVDTPMELHVHKSVKIGHYNYDVYSNPHGLFVMERTIWGKLYPAKNWKEQLQKYEFSDYIINKVNEIIELFREDREDEEDSEKDNEEDYLY